MKERTSITTSESNGMLEVTALGLGSIGLFLFMAGIQDTRLGLELLKYPEAVRNSVATEFAKEFLQRGVREVGLSVAALSGSTGAVIKRIIK